MLVFLKMVGAAIVAIVVLLVVAFFVIRWKIKSWAKGMLEGIKAMATAGVPPFRVKLEPRTDETDNFLMEIPDEFQEAGEELKSLGFEKLGEYFIEEIMMPLDGFYNPERKTYAAVYHHPGVGVWTDIVRRYEDGTSWTFANKLDDLMDRSPRSTCKFFPEESVSTIVRAFHAEAPTDDVVEVGKDDFPRFFERAYAEDMDWRINRGGPTEAEIRRICEREEQECDESHVRAIQDQWRESINFFFSERCIKSYLKQQEATRAVRDHVRTHGVVLHERMQAPGILAALDDEFYPEALEEDFSDFDMDDEDDKEMWEQQQRWSQQIDQLSESLKHDPPQQVFRMMLHSANKLDKWEFLGAVNKPLPADIWLRKIEDEYDSEDEDFEEYDDDDF